MLHCLWSGEIGGAERAVYQLVREQLRDPAIEPGILFAQGRGPYWERARSLGCPVIALDLPNGHAVHRLGAVARAMSGFDLHHFHAAEPLLMLASTRCPDACRVYTHRGGIIDYPPIKRLQYELSGFLLRRRFHGYSGNTAHGAQCGAQLYRLPEARFRVTYNGLDFDLMRPARSASTVRDELGLTKRDFVVGTAANLKPWKRIDRLIDAVHALSDISARLVIVGDGVDRPRLERHARELGVSARVLFVGQKDRAWDYVQAVDAFCLPSMGLESFGNAAVEAMALGVPTIVFADGGGMVEHLQDGETGFIVSDQVELEEALRRLRREPDLRRRIGARAREDVRARYPLERAAKAYRALYAEAIQRVSVPGRR